MHSRNPSLTCVLTLRSRGYNTCFVKLKLQLFDFLWICYTTDPQRIHNDPQQIYKSTTNWQLYKNHNKSNK